MSFVGLLATTTLITLANSTPCLCAAAEQQQQHQHQQQQRAKIPLDHDHFLLVLLLNRQDLGFKTDDLEVPSIVENSYALGPGIEESEDGRGGGDGVGGNDLTRDKRIGSLSIVNSVDVLRQRVLLELARRKAMEDQRQISENRRILDSVGKRSEPIGNYRQRNRREPTGGQLERRLLLLK